MNETYAVIVDGVVVNIVIWDGKTEWQPEEGIAVKLPPNTGIGWGYVDGKFIAPPTVEPTPEEILFNNTSAMQSLNHTATIRISVLTDAIDPDIMGDDINPADVELLKAWKKYRVLLSRVDLTVKEPVWPVKPE